MAFADGAPRGDRHVENSVHEDDGLGGRDRHALSSDRARPLAAEHERRCGAGAAALPEGLAIAGGMNESDELG